MTDLVPVDPPPSPLVGTFIAADAPADRWPVPTALDPKIAMLRAEAEAAPDRFFELAQAARLRALQAQASNTQRGYDSDWRGFVAFCQGAGFRPLPASPPALEAFIEFSLPYSPDIPYQYVLPEAPRRNCRASTVARAIAAIGAVHRWLRYPDPSAHEDVTHTLKINTRRRAAKTPKAPLPYSTIERGIATYGDSLGELRAKALATIAFSTMLRRSELVALQVADFQPSPEADDGTVRVRSSKTDQAGHGAERYVSPDARRHLETWLTAAGLTEGPIFCRLNRNGEPLPKALHANQVALIFKDIARRADFKEHEVTRIAGHSTRIGATQALNAGGASNLQVQLAGGWKGPQMPGVYSREQEVRSGAMAQWFRGRTSPLAPLLTKERGEEEKEDRARGRSVGNGYSG